MKFLNSLFDQCGLLPFSTLVFLCQKMKRKTEKSHETLTNITAYPPRTWLIYSHKLTTSKTFSFFSPFLE
ncbi:dihydropteroate synthase [Listeria monocytogenes]|nr:dihydropteroate synthase [Listeria monocytogenes]